MTLPCLRKIEKKIAMGFDEKLQRLSMSDCWSSVFGQTCMYLKYSENRECQLILHSVAINEFPKRKTNKRKKNIA